MEKFGVARLDSVKAVYGGHLYSVQSNEAIQNGSVGEVGNLLTGEREVRAFNKPTAESIAIEPAVLVANEEINYDQSTRSTYALEAYTNRAKKPLRAYELQAGDIFSVSDNMVDALAAEAVVGNKVTLTVGAHTLSEKTEVTTERFVGRIEAIETIGTPTVVGDEGIINHQVKFVVVRVIKN
jgi:hypothetical protein